MIQVQAEECNSVARERSLETPVFEVTDNGSRYFAFDKQTVDLQMECNQVVHKHQEMVRRLFVTD
jgi:hypothetical protein